VSFKFVSSLHCPQVLAVTSSHAVNEHVPEHLACRVVLSSMAVTCIARIPTLRKFPLEILRGTLVVTRDTRGSPFEIPTSIIRHPYTGIRWLETDPASTLANRMIRSPTPSTWKRVSKSPVWFIDESGGHPGAVYIPSSYPSTAVASWSSPPSIWMTVTSAVTSWFDTASVMFSKGICS